MRAVVIDDTDNGLEAQLKDLDDPVPGEGEIVIDVKACSINFTDVLSLYGKYQNNPDPPFTPGKEGAGIVSAIGPGVADHKVGDRVIGHFQYGAMAEKAACLGRHAFSLPDDIDYDTAAAVGLSYLTAHFAFVRRGALKPGEIVLVNGASGGLGLASVQLAKALGAGFVLAGLTTPAKASAVTAAGADAVIDLTAPELRSSLRQQVYQATGGKGIDLALDLVGGEVFEATVRAIADEGRVVVAGFTSGTIPNLRTNYLLLKNISVVGMTVNAYMDEGRPELRQAQNALFDLLREGKINANITERLPLEQFKQAIDLLHDRKIVGKAVLTMADQ